MLLFRPGAAEAQGLLNNVAAAPEPAQVRVNETVNLKLSFSVAAGEKEHVVVEESRTLSFAQKVLPGYPVVSEKIRSGGRFTTGYAQKIPSVASPGTYRYEVEVCAARVLGGRLSVQVQSVTPVLAQALGVAELTGALVSQLIPGAGERAGLKVGDIVVEFDGRSVKGGPELAQMVAETPINKTVRLKLLRGGKPVELAVTLTDGLLVSFAEEGSLARRIGLLPGDVIAEIDRKQIGGLADYRDALGKIKNNKPTLLYVRRRGGAMFFLAAVIQTGGNPRPLGILDCRTAGASFEVPR